MSNEEPTIPPRQPNTFRTWLPRIWAWLVAHPVWAAAIGGLLAGLLLPQVARLIL